MLICNVFLTAKRTRNCFNSAGRMEKTARMTAPVFFVSQPVTESGFHWPLPSDPSRISFDASGDLPVSGCQYISMRETFSGFLKRIPMLW